VASSWTSGARQKYAFISAFPGVSPYLITFPIENQVAGVSPLVHSDLLSVMKYTMFSKDCCAFMHCVIIIIMILTITGIMLFIYCVLYIIFNIY